MTLYLHAPHLRVVQVEAGVGGGEGHRGPRVHSHYEGLLASCRQNKTLDHIR